MHNVRNVPAVINLTLSPSSIQRRVTVSRSPVQVFAREAVALIIASLEGYPGSLPRRENRSWSILRAGFLGPSAPRSLRRCPAAVLAPHSRSRRSHISALLSCMRVSRRRVAINSTSLVGSWLLRAYAFVDAPGLRVGSR